MRKAQISLLDWLDQVAGRCLPSTALKCTRCGRNFRLKTHLTLYMGEGGGRQLRLGNIGPDFCEGFADYLMGRARNVRLKDASRPLAPGTQRRLFAQFESLLNKAVGAGLLDKNPCRRIAPPLSPSAGVLAFGGTNWKRSAVTS